MSWDEFDAANEARHYASIYWNAQWDRVDQKTALHITLDMGYSCISCGDANQDEFFLVYDTDEIFCEDCCKTVKWE